MEWGKDRTSNVIAALYKAALKIDGGARDRKLWLNYVEGWKPNGSSDKNNNSFQTDTEPPLWHHNDIRFVIDGMPPDLKAKYYGYLEDIIDIANDLKNKGLLKNMDEVPPEKDYDSTILDKGELNSIQEGEKAAKEELKRFNNLSVEERGIDDIRHRGI
jgi:hypothetical protein